MKRDEAAVAKTCEAMDALMPKQGAEPLNVRPQRPIANNAKITMLETSTWYSKSTFFLPPAASPARRRSGLPPPLPKRQFLTRDLGHRRAGDNNALSDLRKRIAGIFFVLK
ncbi:hypothetical protein GCM10023156_40500 [Novipirellula rosea]|uniref:Uncharacterized protein n=1 Tax=Novipirellula rosea TaxID=1031540 RepID=A0ABP8N2A9_9BACT